MASVTGIQSLPIAHDFESQPALGKIDMFDLLWHLEEIRRQLAQSERNYNFDVAAIEGRREQEARKTEVDTYRSKISTGLTLLVTALQGASGACGFGDQKDWKGWRLGLSNIASGVDGLKSIHRMGEDGNRTEASAIAQLCGELRRTAEEAKKRGQQEIADALNQLLKIIADSGHVFDQVVTR